LIGLLLFVVLGLAATLQLRSEKTPTPGAAETDSSAAATNDSEAVETASPVPVTDVLGNDSESQGEQQVVDEQASVEVEQGRRQRGSEDTSAAEGSSDRRERRRKNADSGGRSDDSEEESAGSGKPVSLLIAHRPITAARVGSSELVTVNLDAPSSTRVVLHSGPAGGPYKKARLKAKSGGRWEGWIDFKGTSVGSDFHYWVVASHPRASSNATSASRSSPHRVAIQ